jgi:two-component system response regulator GlrR
MRVGLIGSGAAYSRMKETLLTLASVDVPVLINGETGTGKELAARAMHYLGARRNRSFVPVDCGALPETLFETELFGHLRGAFTDARHENRGLVAHAEGGTLFFDEIHVLSPRSQASLLRFLQDFSYRQLGSPQAKRADVRIVAATNRELKDGMAHGWFREDLLYRLNVANLRMPSLRERVEDIPQLVAVCAQRFCVRYNRPPCSFDDASLAWMMRQPWQGNVRELENFVQRALIACVGTVVHLECCGDADSKNAAPTEIAMPVIVPFNVARAQAIAAFETSYLRAALARTQGNVSQAALQAGKERRVFGRLLKKHGIDRSEYL